MARDLVLTPGGYRNRALVHRLEPGEVVQHDRDRIRLFHTPTKTSKDLAEVALQPGDVPGFGTGWIVYGAWTNNTGSPISSFETKWQVPPPPKTASDQIIFLFNGIDPADPSAAILQPVLQWGVSAAGGGPFWSVASWYVLGSGEAFHTDLVQVDVGDELVGLMNLTNSTNGQFSYTSEFQGINGTSLPVENVAELVWCNQTLEAYGITACSDYPNTDSTAMAGINLKTTAGTPPVNWTPVDLVTDCGQHASIVVDSGKGGEVDLFYGPPVLTRIDLDRFAKNVRVLFGVTNDGGGIVILPNGHIVRIPPHNPLTPVFLEIADGLMDVGRGFAIQEAAQGTSLESANQSIQATSLDMMADGLDRAAQAVDKVRSAGP